MNRRAKLVTVLFVVLAASGVILWNTAAQSAPPALGVTEAKRGAEALLGREVSVRGVVVEGSIVERGNVVESFLVEDSFERLRVDFNATPPDNFGVKEVVVRGTLVIGADRVASLQAISIQVGCSSKY